MSALIDVNRLAFIGADLYRPECVQTHPDGSVHVADWRGGVTIIKPDGQQNTVLAKTDFKPKTNGLALQPDGSWLITHLGDTEGGVFRLAGDGSLIPLLLEVNGSALPPTNYVHVDILGRVWVTVSTRKIPRHLSCHAKCDDGFMVLIDAKGARIVADGLGFANECVYHHDNQQIYVNETFTRRLTRFDVAQNGDLSNRVTVTQFGAGTYPDGLTFDADGSIWVTSIVSNRILKVAPDGDYKILLEDCEAEHLRQTEEAYQKNTLTKAHLDTPSGKILKNISSLAFGGPDLKRIYLGCLLGQSIAWIDTGQMGIKNSIWQTMQAAT